MRRAGVAIASCALLTLFACANDSSGGATTGGDLTGVTWVLDHASMMTLVDTVPTGARIDIAFDSSDVHGRAACNSYGGGYEPMRAPARCPSRISPRPRWPATRR